MYIYIHNNNNNWYFSRRGIGVVVEVIELRVGVVGITEKYLIIYYNINEHKWIWLVPEVSLKVLYGIQRFSHSPIIKYIVK